MSDVKVLTPEEIWASKANMSLVDSTVQLINLELAKVQDMSDEINIDVAIPAAELGLVICKLRCAGYVVSTRWRTNSQEVNLKTIVIKLVQNLR